MSKTFAIGLILAACASATSAAPITVDKTGILNPNPSNLAIVEAGNTSLAAARALVSAASAAGTGGVLDFQQRKQGGTFANSTAPNNGVDLAAGAANRIYVTNGATGDGLVGTPFFSFYRLEGDTIGVTYAFDSNLDQGGNVISGGFQSRYPGAVSGTNPSGDGSSVTGVNAAYAPNITTSIGGAYFGITATASPATLVFDNPLSFFGITALPRGSSRDSLITLTLSDNSTVTVGGTQLVTTSAVFFGYAAPDGLTISRAAITNPGGQGQNRYDDLAFVVAPIPEPAALASLAGLAGVAIARRRRAPSVS